METDEILKLHQTLLKNNNSFKFSQKLKFNPLKPNKKCVRPNSICIEDAFFGDSGKGRVTAEINRLLGKKGKLFSLRYNGGANAGHECFVNGKVVNVHQLPTGVIQEGATAIMGRGMVIHPDDLMIEIGIISGLFGGKLPGKLVIDERTVLSLDTHRAFETALNNETMGGRGSTGRGIATSYSSFYERVAVTVKDLMADDWKKIFSQHFCLYQKLIAGLGNVNLADTSVVTADLKSGGKRKVGKEKEFIERLNSVRRDIRSYVSRDIFHLLKDAWDNPKISFSIEGAQGAGLDPYHGVYPDVTASRPMSRNINDTTYNIILPEEIAMKVAVMKTTYLSSIGQRRLPTVKDEIYEKWIQETFDERGRSTGRLRDIYPVSLPIAQYLKRAAGYDFLVTTHLDASQKDKPIKIISHYTDRKTGIERPYFPYQDYLDNLKAHIIEFPGWDGQEIKRAKTPDDLPFETKIYLEFLSRTISPVVLGTSDPTLGNYLSWLPDF